MLPEPGHGTRATYDRHRRAGEEACEPCKRAAARYEQERQLDLLSGRGPRMVDATGTRRRIQALIALGYRHTLLAAELGVSHDVIRKRSLAPKVNRDTAAAVTAMYERLSMRLPVGRTHGERVAVSRARNLARRNGWPPPLAWPEDRIDDPAYRPVDWAYTATDRRQALHDMADMGLGITEACRRLRLGREAVERWCQRNGETAVYHVLAGREHRNGNQHSEEVA